MSFLPRRVIANQPAGWWVEFPPAASSPPASSEEPGSALLAAAVPFLPLARAQASGVTHIALFAAASETFSRRNINQSIAESLETYSAVATART